MNEDSDHRPVEELRRIRSVAWLGAMILLLLPVLDSPVTTLGWLTLGGGILSMLYIALAATFGLRNHRSSQQRL